jgi:hypothetical protein
MKIVQSSGLPILSIWADQEQWWGDWGRYNDARWGRRAWKEVPVIAAAALERHYHNFATLLWTAFPNSGIYTGRGFITTYAPAMKFWLADHLIWFAQYRFQPGKATNMTWQELKREWLPDYDPDIRDTGIRAEHVMGHQFSGDVCMLPGSYQNIFGRRTPMDLSVFRADFMEKLGGTPLSPLGDIPPFEKPQMGGDEGKEYIFLGNFLWVRSMPDESGKFKLVDSLMKSQRVTVLEIRGKWARIEKPAGWVDFAWLTRV